MKIDRFVEDEEGPVEIAIELDGKRGPFDYDELLAAGMIKQRQKDLYTVRLRCPGGRVSLRKLRAITDAVEQYGDDYIHLSFRQSVEIPYVNSSHLAPLKDLLEEAGQEFATCGARIRVPTACSGCEYNPNALVDTQKMAGIIDGECFGKPLPHKFKISFSGCNIDCARTSSADLGFQGAVLPEFVSESCTACGFCIAGCAEEALRPDSSGKPVLDSEKCTYCARCIRVCPAEACRAVKTGWIVRCGGKHGPHPAVGHVLAEFVSDVDIVAIVKVVSDWYAEKAASQARIRLSTLLQRPDLWQDFVGHVRNYIGQNMRTGPKPPTPIDLYD
ncbi:4Fe-4S dicluster domain-containing protein [Candidatus Hydrogenedentota bacterium]